ncbi:metallophosphoesterase [Halomonas sp. NO4]|uniref:metallophosphoesterase n=1 Tax=Halomonas sp. NO4 TaxID=2484813 RepID=UPI0013D7558C|nr:metallophosphoesterase [Halomonas sp. NO4]
MIQCHAENRHGRDFVVGDIHGEYRLLEQALCRVDFQAARDRLFAVGDLIDRGPDSFACLALALEPWFCGVRGNHEELAQAALGSGGGGDWGLWLMNGGTWVRRHDAEVVRRRLEAALARLPLAREVVVAGKRLGIVHAEPPSDWAQVETADADEALAHQLVWGRRRIARQDTTPVTGIDAVAVGHTIVPVPVQLGNVHYLDTGAFNTGRLTLVEARELVE